MKRTLLVLGMVLALAMTAMANAEPEYPDGIASPTAGEVVYENTLYLEARNKETEASLLDATNPDRTSDWVAWAVRSPVEGTCDGDGNNWAGDTNSDVFAGTKAFDAATGTFTAEIDISTWPAGEYCFVFVPTDQVESRQYLSFYIVDEYAKVGGVIDLSEGAPKKGNGTHSMEGVVGIAGSYGTVGSVTINYRELDEVCTFTPGNFGLNAAPGIGVYDNLRGDLNEFNNSCGGTARLLVLDRDASTVYPRGAIYVDKADSGYGIDLDPNDNSGPGNWVPMLRGNNHVGTR